MAEKVAAEEVEDPRRRIRLKTVDDIRVEMAHIYRSAKNKSLPLADATRLIYVLQQIAVTTHSAVTEAKVNAITEALQRRGLITGGGGSLAQIAALDSRDREGDGD